MRSLADTFCMMITFICLMIEAYDSGKRKKYVAMVFNIIAAAIVLALTYTM